MKLTARWLQKNKACREAADWVEKQSDKDELVLFEKCLAEKRFGWAGWWLVRRLSLSDKRRYAIYSAEQVLSFFEDKHPNDKRPRRALAAARKCLKAPTKKNKDAAAAAGDAACAAGDAATVAVHAADATATVVYAAYADADVTAAVAYAAACAAYAAADTTAAVANAAAAAYNAADAAANAANTVIIKTLRYGLRLYKASQGNPNRPGRWHRNRQWRIK